LSRTREISVLDRKDQPLVPCDASLWEALVGGVEQRCERSPEDPDLTGEEEFRVLSSCGVSVVGMSLDRELVRSGETLE